MGLQLREALQCLCVEIGWTYAVFWRAVESGNPIHFVWEDGHWVQDSLSNYSAEFQCQAEDRVKLLVNKLMVPQVHVIGDGVVGQAAFSGSHQWIVRDARNDYGSVYKDLAELNHQFMAGIQTIAVIPVLPHGVLQLGSTQMVMENIGFVNHVRNLFAQLKCVTGALLPFVTKKALTQNSQLYDEIPPIASKVLRNKLTITTTKVPVNEPFQPMIHPVDARLIQLPLSHDSTSKYEDQPSVLTSGLSSSSLPFLEQLLAMSSISSWESANITEPALIDNKALHLRSHGCMLPNSLKDSNIISLFGRSETSENANGLGRFRSLPGDSRESIGIPYATSSSTEAAQMLNQRNHSKSSQGISVDPCPSDLSINNSQSVLTVGKRKQENDLFHTCDVPFTEFDVNGPCYWALFSTLQECRLSSSNTVQENHNAIWDANDTNTTKNKQNMKDNDESKLPRIFPKQTTSGNDLYDVLGPDYKIDNFGGSLDDVFVHKGDASIHELATDISTCTTQLDVCPISHSMNNGISGAGMFSIADADQLLDAVVSKINSGAKQNSDDNASCKTSVTKISSSSLPVVSLNYDLVASSEQNQGESFGLSPMLGKPEVAGSSSVKSACSLGNVTEECSQSAGVHKSQISLWVESGQSMKCDNNLSGAHCKRVDETGKVNQKRARPGKNPRPRPKDRQMIMDRVKELREIVPNGAKCSIDALLEKTIKHMLFLQSVTKHADKLKDIGEPKFINKEGGLLLKENFEGGATWAFEIGTQSMTCPIIVEDLNPPRQMLVEMLWEQRGFFLEIADLIRGLGLTILKGWMEARKDKIWARFAVEANRDVTRMEIFLLLVRLLEPTVGSQTTPQGVDNINMPHNMYHRSCIPATGTSDRLR